MKTPSGLVTARVSPRNTTIYSQPFRVISEFLRAQQRVEQVHRGDSADDEHDHGLGVHKVLLLHAIAEIHIADRSCKECDGDGYPKNVLHSNLLFPAIRSPPELPVLGSGMSPRHTQCGDRDFHNVTGDSRWKTLSLLFDDPSRKNGNNNS
jgi:hypothetical protein